MKLRQTALALIALLPAAAGASRARWHGDYYKAVAEVKATNKLLFISFDGSNWVSFTDKLRKEVYSQPEFIDYAERNLVLLEIDFPRGKSDLPTIDPPSEKINKTVAQKLGINPYDNAELPRAVVLTKDGKEVARLPYLHGGAAAFIAALEAQLKKAGYTR